jgi:hypothetical protein
MALRELAQEGPAACAGGDARRPWRRGDVLTLTAVESRGKRAGEQEGLAGKLTTGSNRAEDGRRGDFNGEGEASGADDDGAWRRRPGSDRLTA